jgi:hypothetical protein
MARVSTYPARDASGLSGTSRIDEQNLALQRDALERAGCKRVYPASLTRFAAIVMTPSNPDGTYDHEH